MPLFLLIFFLLLISYAVLIGYYHHAWNKIPVFTYPPSKVPSTFVTIVIAVRNEEKNIPALLEALHQQNYPKELYEVVLVDDHSTDRTWEMITQPDLAGMQLQAIRLQDHLPDNTVTNSFKKKAIETGISVSKGNLIVTTDADCRFDPEWLSVMVSYYEKTGAKFIAAPVKITGKRSLLHIFQSLDFLTLQGITGASVFRRFHTMCNGANLAYEKQAFLDVNGFANIDHLPTGDDMLLMHKIYKKYPGLVFYLKHPSVIVSTEPAPTWKAFFHQRIRWASKADSYDDKRIFWTLLLVYLVNIGFLVLGIAACFKLIWLFFLLILLLAKVLIEFPFVHAVAIFFRQQRLMPYFPFLQPLHILYTIVAGWLGKFGHYEWKGRRIEKTSGKSNS